MSGKNETEYNRGIIVYLTLFSGRRDLCWALKESEIKELNEKMKDLPKTRTIEYPILGYRGFEVINKNRILGIPERIIIFNKTISMKKNDEVVFYEDKNGIEEWLFELGREQGHEKIIESIGRR